jgi:hypothetical protein
MEHTSTRSAVISGDDKYRYHLWRRIADRGCIATFIMLNPSTADGLIDDPTIRKCMGFCERWGCGELHVVNLFAFRATDPADLRRADDPVGPDNFDWVRRTVDLAWNRILSGRRGRVVCSWGTRGTHMSQDQTVLGWIAERCKPMCLGITQDGHPRHPLYVPYCSANDLCRYPFRKTRSNRCERPSTSEIRKDLPQPAAR